MSEFNRLIHKGIVKEEPSQVKNVETSRSWLKVLPYEGPAEQVIDFKKTTRRKSKSGNSKNFVFATYGNYSHMIGFNANYREPYDIKCDRNANRHKDLQDLELFRLALLFDLTIDNLERSMIEELLEKRICTDCLGKAHN